MFLGILALKLHVAASFTFDVGPNSYSQTLPFSVADGEIAVIHHKKRKHSARFMQAAASHVKKRTGSPEYSHLDKVSHRMGIFASTNKVQSAFTSASSAAPAAAPAALLGAAAPVAASAEEEFGNLMDTVFGKDEKSPKYDKEQRPSLNDVKVLTRMRMRHLNGLDNLKGMLSVSVWLTLAWRDDRLKYNASEQLPKHNATWNSAADYVSIPDDKVWMPNVGLLNEVEAGEYVSDFGWLTERRPTVRWYDQQHLKDKGYNVLKVMPLVLNSHCGISLKDFPFDIQSCKLDLGDLSASWQKSQVAPLDAKEWEENCKHDASTKAKCEKFGELSDEEEEECAKCQFELRSASEDIELREVVVKQTKMPYDKSGLQDEEESVASYTLVLERDPNYYLIKLIVPEFLLVLFGHSIFYVEQGASRIQNGITLVLAVMTVSFLTLNSLPFTSEVMWIEKLQVGCYVLTCVPAFIAILMHHLEFIVTDGEGSGAGTQDWVVKDTLWMWDCAARLGNSVLVILWYIYMFPFHSRFGILYRDKYALDPVSHPVHQCTGQLAVFFLINVLIFVVLFIVAIVDALASTKRLEKEINSWLDREQRQKKITRLKRAYNNDLGTKSTALRNEMEGIDEPMSGQSVYKGGSAGIRSPRQEAASKGAHVHFDEGSAEINQYSQSTSTTDSAPEKKLPCQAGACCVCCFLALFCLALPFVIVLSDKGRPGQFREYLGFEGRGP